MRFKIQFVYSEGLVGDEFLTIDKAGNLHESTGGTYGSESCYLTFSLSPDELTGFARCAQDVGEVMFRNVSLVPGQFSEVQIESEFYPVDDREKPTVQVEAEGAKVAGVGISGGEVKVFRDKDGPEIVVRTKPRPEGTVYYKKFDKKYLLEMISKSLGQPITKTLGKESSGSGSSSREVHKRIGFGIPFPYREIERRRKMSGFHRNLGELIKEDIKNTLGVMAYGGGGLVIYTTDEVVGLIDTYFSQTNEDILQGRLQIKFVIQEVATVQDKSDAQIEVYDVKVGPPLSQDNYRLAVANIRDFDSGVVSSSVKQLIITAYGQRMIKVTTEDDSRLEVLAMPYSESLGNLSVAKVILSAKLEKSPKAIFTWLVEVRTSTGKGGAPDRHSVSLDKNLADLVTLDIKSGDYPIGQDLKLGVVEGRQLILNVK